MNYTFEYGEVVSHIPYLLGGAVLTLQIAFVAFWGGAGDRLVWRNRESIWQSPEPLSDQRLCDLFHQYALHWCRFFSCFTQLPEIGVLLDPLPAVLIGLVLNAGAYLTDILRAGVISVRQAEIEAGLTLGMSRLQLVRHVMLPHIARTIYAPLSNFFIWLVLGSSLAALFAVEELTGRAINISTANLRTIETFTVIAAIYVALTFAASITLALIGRYVFRVKARIF